MHTERLREMVRLMKSVADKTCPTERSFNLDTWDCGMYACAMGFACHHPPFMEQGLWNNGGIGRPRFQAAESGIGAAALFFDISEITASRLFLDTYYTSLENPLLVAERIEELLERGNLAHIKQLR